MKISINNITLDNSDNFLYDDPYLPVHEHVVLNQLLVDSITNIRWYYAKYHHKSAITSGYRDADYQLQSVIIPFVKEYGVMTICPEILKGLTNGWSVDKGIASPELYPDFPISVIYWWQRAWSKLLAKSINLIVNPPLEAICLEHSLRPDGTDRYGNIIGQTPHARGTAYDQDGGQDHDPSNELMIMQEASKNPICMIKDLVIERQQNCLHTDLRLGDYIFI
jgi:hypothetical protein